MRRLVRSTILAGSLLNPAASVAHAQESSITVPSGQELLAINDGRAEEAAIANAFANGASSLQLLFADGKSFNIKREDFEHIAAARDEECAKLGIEPMKLRFLSRWDPGNILPPMDGGTDLLVYAGLSENEQTKNTARETIAIQTHNAAIEGNIHPLKQGYVFWGTLNELSVPELLARAPKDAETLNIYVPAGGFGAQEKILHYEIARQKLLDFDARGRAYLEKVGLGDMQLLIDPVREFNDTSFDPTPGQQKDSVRPLPKYIGVSLRELEQEPIENVIGSEGHEAGHIWLKRHGRHYPPRKTENKSDEFSARTTCDDGLLHGFKYEQEKRTELGLPPQERSATHDSTESRIRRLEKNRKKDIKACRDGTGLKRF